MDAFKSPFSFEEFFKALVEDVLPFLGDGMVDGNQADSEDGSSLIDRAYGGAPIDPPFREAEKLPPLLKRTRTNLVGLCYQVDARSEILRNEVGSYSMDHEQIFVELLLLLILNYSLLDCSEREIPERLETLETTQHALQLCSKVGQAWHLYNQHTRLANIPELSSKWLEILLGDPLVIHLSFQEGVQQEGDHQEDLANK